MNAIAAEIAARVARLDDRSTKPLREIRREYSKQLRSESGPEVIEVALALMPDHRFILAAHEVTSRVRREVESKLTTGKKRG